MTELNDGGGDVRRYGNHPGAVASLAAIASVLAASSCCLPICRLYWARNLPAHRRSFPWRDRLLVLSILFISYGFHPARKAKKCRRRPSLIATALLCVSTVFVLTSIFFPQVMANAAANMLAR